jgi:formate dehydrogenase iron-sulfur subunit
MGSRSLPVLTQNPARPAGAADSQRVAPSAAGTQTEPMGFFTDTTVCIGCKACEVACKEWNQLPARGD